MESNGEVSEEGAVQSDRCLFELCTKIVDQVRNGKRSENTKVLTTLQYLLEEPFAEDLYELPPETIVKVHNFLILNGEGYFPDSIFRRSEISNENGQDEGDHGLVLIADGLIPEANAGDRDCVVLVKVSVPYVNWDSQYNFVGAGVTAFDDSSERRWYFEFCEFDATDGNISLASGPHEEYARIYALTVNIIQHCGTLLKLANKVNGNGVAEDDIENDFESINEEENEENEDESTADVLGEADHETFEALKAVFETDLRKLYGYRNHKQYSDCKREVEIFMVDQAANIDSQDRKREMKSLICTEFFVPFLISSGLDIEILIRHDLNRVTEYNEMLKTIDENYSCLLPKISDRKKAKKIVHPRLRAEARTVQSTAETAVTALTKSMFMCTAPVLMNQDGPRQDASCQMSRPRVLANELLASSANTIKLKEFGNQIGPTEEIGRSEVRYYENFTLKMLKNGNCNNMEKDIVISRGDCVQILVDQADQLENGPALQVVHVVKIMEYHNKNTFAIKRLVHGHLLCHSSETILGHNDIVGRANELFFTFKCKDVKIKDILNKVNVLYIEPLDKRRFAHFTSEQMLEYYRKPEGCSFQQYFLRQGYDDSVPKFIYVDYLKNAFEQVTCSCAHIANAKYKKGRNLAETCRPGDVLMLNANSVKRLGVDPDQQGERPRFWELLSDRQKFDERMKPFTSDELLYPEADRYIDWIRKSPARDWAYAQPFDIAIVEENSHQLKLRFFYRPEETTLTDGEVRLSDRHELYLSNEVINLSAEKQKNIMGRCFVKYISSEETDSSFDVTKWLAEGPLRYYCRKTFDGKEKKFANLSAELAEKVLFGGTGENFPKIDTPLRTLDIYSGAGGLSQGLHEAQLIRSDYAIEYMDSHARVFQRNFPQATVFCTDVNEMLERMIQKQLKMDEKGRRYPQRGDVDMVCGGPPCQGFSGMNSKKHGEASCKKRSLIAPFMTMVDYLRPRYVLMENVSGMAMKVETGRKLSSSAKNGCKNGKLAVEEKVEVLAVLMEVLRAIGYQVTVCKMQAARYGVAQDRRRVFILGAAPFEPLPEWPLPITTCPPSLFERQRLHQQVAHLKINGKLYKNSSWSGDSLSAPYRGKTVFDAIYDLPFDLDNQAMDKISDHEIISMSNLLKARIMHVPKATCLPFPDWRLLPNKEFKLFDTKISKLEYRYAGIVFCKEQPRRGRGVCPCEGRGSKCSARDRCLQRNTLIPAPLPHNGYRFQQWQGLFGRPGWDSLFQTIVTVPNPFNKQGQVLHPVENRLLSVREVARGQGFPDSFVFSPSQASHSTINAKYQQVGNAVPPPMARAIGRCIVAAVADKQNRQQKAKTTF